MCTKGLARGLDRTGRKSMSSYTVCVTRYDIKDYEEKGLDKKQDWTSVFVQS